MELGEGDVTMGVRFISIEVALRIWCWEKSL